MGRGGGRMGGSRGGFRGFSGGGSFSRGFSSRRSSSQRSSSVFSPGSRPSSAFYSDRQRLGRGGGISRNGYYRRTSGSSLWPLLFLPRNRTTVVVNNGSPVDPVSPSVPYEQPMPQDSPGTPDKGSESSGKGLMTALIILAIIAEIFLMPVAFSGSDRTEPRQKLSAAQVQLTDSWYDDQLLWIYDEDELLAGLRHFYDETGIQPYLLICDSLDGYGYGPSQSDEAYIEALYDSLFEDEGHMIFVFMEFAASEYVTYIYTGAAADTVMDAEARELMLDNADRLYYDTSLSDEEFFSELFSETADEIMGSTDSGDAGRTLARAAAALIPVAVAAACFVIYMKRRAAKRAAKVREILDTPIGESPEDKALREKYKEDEQDGRNI